MFQSVGETDAATNGIVLEGPHVAIVASTAAKDDHVEADNGVELSLLSVPPPPPQQQIGGQRHAMEIPQLSPLW
jgi:hypothetical protein